MNHEKLEKNIGLMGVTIALVISVAGLVELIPLMFQAETTTPIEGVEPYAPLELAGGARSRGRRCCDGRRLHLGRCTHEERARRRSLDALQIAIIRSTARRALSATAGSISTRGSSDSSDS